MSVVYSMYDALVSINVSDEKARAVIDAMEREMMAKLATSADVTHLRELVSRDLQAIRLEMSSSLERLDSRLTLKLGTIAGAWTGILFALLKLT